MVVEGLMSHTRPHFSNTCPKRVGLCPGCLQILATSPSNTMHIAERVVRLAIITMFIDMPGGNSDLKLYLGIELQVVREVFHMPQEVFEPLASNVIWEDNTGELNICKWRQNDYSPCYSTYRVVCQHQERKKSKRSYFLPFCRSPTPFFRTRQCLEHTHRLVSVTLYPGEQRTAAQTTAMCSDWQVLIWSYIKLKSQEQCV